MNLKNLATIILCLSLLAACINGLALNRRGLDQGREAPPVNVSIRTDNNDNFEAGSPRVLACIVYGCVSSPTVTWYLGDTMLRPNVYKEVNRGNFTVSSLTFVPSLNDDHKDLVCKVTDNHMAETFEDRVTVSVGQRPICIDSGFKTVGAVMGDSETLVCIVESNPEPEQFIWTFADGRTLYTSSKKVSGHVTRYSSTLVWVPREDDFGPLYCRASNRFGEQKQPCTFSVINGGAPTTPECELFWEDHETLKLKCDQNWDGGRPQTIYLEIKGPEGTRKVSKKGHELKVNSLQGHANFTAVLYASNSRGRSGVVQLTIPPPPADTPMQAFANSQSRWLWWLQVGVGMVAVFSAICGICMCIYYSLRERCGYASSDNDLDERDLELMKVDDIPNNCPTHPPRARDDDLPTCLNFCDEISAPRQHFYPARVIRLKEDCRKQHYV